MKVNQKKVGVVLSYLTQLINMLSAIIYTPIMLRLLGQSEYGLYQLVYSVVSYLSLLSLGFGAAYMRFYVQQKNKDEKEGAARLNGMFLIIFMVIAIVCLVCGGAMISNIHYIFGEGLTNNEYQTISYLLTLMVINMAISLISTVFGCYITAHEKFVFQKSLLLGQSLLNPFICLPLLVLGFGSVGMVIVSTILTLFTLGANVVFCIRKLKMKFKFRNLEFGLLKEMWAFTFFIFLNQIIDQVNWSVDKFLIGRLKGTMMVAVYGVASQINSIYLNFSVAISGMFIPKVNYLVGENDDEQLSKLFIKVGRIQFMVMGLILTGFIFLGKPFIDIWAGAGYEEVYYIALLLIASVTIPLIQNLGIEIQRAKNKHQVRSIVYMFIAIGNVGISIPLIQHWGAVGAAIGTACGLILGNVIFMNIYYHKKMGLDIIAFWKNIIIMLPGFIIPTVAGGLLVKINKYQGFKEIVIDVSIYTVVYLISMWFLGMNEYEKQLVSSLYKKVNPKKMKAA